MNPFSRRQRKANIRHYYTFMHGRFYYELRFVDKDGTHFFRKVDCQDEGGFIMSAAQVKVRLFKVSYG
jgi:hypothetical protein